MKRDLGDGFELDDAKGRLDLGEVHRFMSEESYWAKGRAREVQDRLVAEAARVVGLDIAGVDLVATDVRRTMEEHWQSGYDDTVRTLGDPEVLQRPDKLQGVRTFDLARTEHG